MTIQISALEFECIVGILESERHSRQRVVVDVVMEYEYKDSRYIDYAKVAALIQECMICSKFKLLEDALEAIEELLFARFDQIQSLNLSICKPDILPNCRVSVIKNSVS